MVLGLRSRMDLVRGVARFVENKIRTCSDFIYLTMILMWENRFPDDDAPQDWNSAKSIEIEIEICQIDWDRDWDRAQFCQIDLRSAKSIWDRAKSKVSIMRKKTALGCDPKISCQICAAAKLNGAPPNPFEIGAPKPWKTCQMIEISKWMDSQKKVT